MNKNHEIRVVNGSVFLSLLTCVAGGIAALANPAMADVTLNNANVQSFEIQGKLVRVSSSDSEVEIVVESSGSQSKVVLSGGDYERGKAAEQQLRETSTGSPLAIYKGTLGTCYSVFDGQERLVLWL